MSRHLCTFPGKFGDILWSLPTARYIAEKMAGEPVDFAVMPYYQSLLPLLVEQPYIANAFTVGNWVRTHSNNGDQPWKAPEVYALPKGTKYDKVWHLGYRGHPGLTAPTLALLNFIGFQQGILFKESQVPFISLANDEVRNRAEDIHLASGKLVEVIQENRLITYAFNEQYQKEKQDFLEALWTALQGSGLEFFNVSTVGWREAAWLIKNARVHVGCRSACWVLATGVGKETITYEPHMARHKRGRLGSVFGCPYGKETTLPLMMPARVAGATAAELVRGKATERRETVGAT